MSPEERRQKIERYKDGYQVVANALVGMTDTELDVHPAPGKWSAREIVHHLADSEMTAAVRLRLLIAEDHPTIHGYDQDEYARKLYYDRPYEASLEAFQAARAVTAQLLDRMTDAEWLREGAHTESGRYSAERWLEIYAEHAHKHAEQISRARAAAPKHF
ncbi:MAG: DinB family protein [Acidobacteria bacterium]|nr:DinB family protein [Acidobacteriota bacterium]